MSQIDLINVLSFLISIENLKANLTQNDKSDLQADLSEKSEKIIGEIQEHLEEQDRKIDEILKRLKDLGV